MVLTALDPPHVFPATKQLIEGGMGVFFFTALYTYTFTNQITSK
jgi:hypothetical protein